LVDYLIDIVRYHTQRNVTLTPLQIQQQLQLVANGAGPALVSGAHHHLRFFPVTELQLGHNRMGDICGP